MSVRDVNQRWLSTMALDDGSIEFQRRLEILRAGFRPRPPWWRPGARRRWAADLATAERACLDTMLMELYGP